MRNIVVTLIVSAIAIAIAAAPTIAAIANMAGKLEGTF